MTAAVIVILILAVCLALFLIGIKTDAESAPIGRPAGSLAPRPPDASPQPALEEGTPGQPREVDATSPKPSGVEDGQSVR